MNAQLRALAVSSIALYAHQVEFFRQMRNMTEAAKNDPANRDELLEAMVETIDDAIAMSEKSLADMRMVLD